MVESNDLFVMSDGDDIYVVPGGLRLTYSQALWLAGQLVEHAAAIDPRLSDRPINNDNEDDAA